MSEKEPRLPFRERPVDMETPRKNFEVRIKELEGQGFVIKEVKIEHEDLLEAAQEKYQKSIDLLQENGFGEFLPKTFVIIGEGSEGTPSIYIAQEKIEGSHYDEIIDHNAVPDLIEYYKQQIEASSPEDEGKESKPDFEGYPHRDILEQVDRLAVRSLELWEKTHNLSPAEREKLPIAMALGQEIRKSRENEGILPEIMNPINMMWGRRPGKDEVDRLFLVDTGLFTLDSDDLFSSRYTKGDLAGHYNDARANLERFLPASLLDRARKKLIELSDEETYNEFADSFPRESGELYKRLREKYSKNTEGDEK